ncbi:hypothetical protein HRbin17_01145 [bacterium HR17]|uniref:DUF2892 domain-containing protein n=1 Tax=Candidatus Fervidibacter japonicus TaxID=2035412 RepID=A0A2H5XBQ9_9BACT|nr:hypothetical protein HRbin17_01145 [bacterium HR17]
MFKPNIDTPQRWVRGISGTALLLAAVVLPRLPAWGRLALAALGVLGIAQALSGI